ncbi:DUF397 domain-containing protein [Streptomyces olivochromogenes]|uniref:DUF397 domain-containing protein n=1 Tax=Streptomyces olivochromogenes TaxID=1963 RepID=UPI0035B40F6B|nr:DUF397 domain-containing protein [Streptomyces olivochromogenes]
MQAELSRASWYRSSACGDGASCVEVAHPGTSIGVRDSWGAVLVFSELAWQLFTTAFQCGNCGEGRVGGTGFGYQPLQILA